MIGSGILLSLRPPATLVPVGGREAPLRVRLPNATLDFPSLSPHVARALRRLPRGASDHQFAKMVAADGDDALASWYYCLGEIERLGGIVYEVFHGKRPLARAVVMSPYFRAGTGVVLQEQRWLLSRFAFLRRSDSRLVLESPLSCARIELLHPAAANLIASLATPSRAADAARAVPGVAQRTAADFLALLAYAGMLARVDGKGSADEDESPVLRTWHFADLLFHARSRGGRHDEPYDLFRFRGKLPSLPAVKPPTSGATIVLYAPDLAQLTTRDVPFTRVVEERRSVREYGKHPIAVRQLGEFLYRVARVKRVIEPDGERILYQASARPYPGGGACYELELYLAVNRCDGLAQGLYHYDPLNHRLETIPNSERHLEQMIRQTIPGEATAPRQVLIVIAARFQRVAWKYNASSYASILKDVGVLFQTMYLVATAMSLAPCALGGGDSELFARALGVPYLEENAVGEFLLGSRRKASLASERDGGNALVSDPWGTRVRITAER